MKHVQTALCPVRCAPVRLCPVRCEMAHCRRARSCNSFNL
jgi:hypothetical protein